MFCPRMHQEYLHKPTGNFGIAIDSPPIRPITTPHGCVLTDRFHEFCLLPRNDRVVNCDQHRASKQVSANLFDDHWHTPVIPGAEICGGIRKPGEKGKYHAPKSSQSGIYKSQANTLSLSHTAPGRASQCKTSHIDERENRQHARSNPVRG